MEDTEVYFNLAVSKVESKSIQEWATTENNRKHFLEAAVKAIGKKKSPEDFAKFIITLAMGHRASI